VVEAPFSGIDGDLKSAIVHIYTSFNRYMSLDMDNKTTNYHNCRKSALLSKLLIKNKLLMLLGVDVKSFIE
jgi:hypothetical protein